MEKAEGMDKGKEEEEKGAGAEGVGGEAGGTRPRGGGR